MKYTKDQILKARHEMHVELNMTSKARYFTQGYTDHDKRYIKRNIYPQFIAYEAQWHDYGEEFEDEPVIEQFTKGGDVLKNKDFLYDVNWIDTRPSDSEVQRIMEEAEAVFQEMNSWPLNIKAALAAKRRLYPEYYL
jgi:hypothetical protein